MDLFNFVWYIRSAIENPDPTYQAFYTGGPLRVSDKVGPEDCLSAGMFNGKC
jgi:hypothetical protein